jgi:hypothetical protein
MNDSEFERLTAIVEDALRTMPLATVPGTLRSRVMKRVRLVSSAPKFAFPWLEGAISLMLSTLLTSMAYVLIGIQPATLLRLEQSVRMFFLIPTNRPVLLATLPALGLLAVCLLLTVRLFRPRSRAGAKIVALR